jgi:hypothetical protein
MLPWHGIGVTWPGGSGQVPVPGQRFRRFGNKTRPHRKTGEKQIETECDE